VVFYSPKAVAIKQLEPVSKEQILEAFDRDDLLVHTDPATFKEWLFAQDLDHSAVLMMSSGNYGGLDLQELKGLIK